MSDATLSLIVLGVAIALFVWNRLPVGAVAILTALGLYATGVIDATTAVSGFGDPVVVFIATLFVISEGLESSGVTAWAGQTLLERVGASRSALLVALMALAAVMAALVTPNGAAAALLPVMVLAARRSRASTSRFAMPLAFAASAGALLALSGSTVNVIVSGALAEATGDRFGFFEFAIAGVPLLAVTVAVSLFGARLLPERTPASLPTDFTEHLDTLVDHYELNEGFFRLRLSPRSSLVGRTLDEAGVPEGVQIVGAQDTAGQPRATSAALRGGDVVVVSGRSPGITELAAEMDLTIVNTPLTRATRAALLGREAGLAELVVAPRSRLIGEQMFPGLARSGVVVLAISHLGRDTGLQPVSLKEGDAILVNGPWHRIEDLGTSRDVLVVDSPELLRRQTIALGPKAPRALAVLAVTVVLLAFGLVPPAIAGLIGAVGMVLTGVVGVPQAYRAISWQTVVLVGGLIPLSVAIQSSGAADLAAGLLVDVVPPGNGYLLLVALFVLTAVLGQVVSNTATVLIVVPIAVAAAAESGIALPPVLMLVAVAGAASFLTPIATPANMMVMGPGGYRFGDYWKLGIVTMLAWLGVAVLLIPVVWPLTPS